MKDTTIRERIEWKDIAAAIIMILIWIAHYTPAGAGGFRDYVIRFCNNALFLLSGLFAYKLRDMSLGQIVQSRFMSLLVPYVLWGTIGAIYYFVQNRICFKDAIFMWLQFLEFRASSIILVGPIWFLAGLFSCTILFKVITMLCGKNNLQVGIACLIIQLLCWWKIRYSSLFDYLFLGGCCYIFFFYLGYISLATLQNWGRKMRNRRVRTWAWCIICLLAPLNAYTFHKGTGVWGGANSLFWNYILLDGVFPLQATIFVILIAMIIPKRKCLIVLGQNTLLLCGMELIIKTGMEDILKIMGIEFVLSNSAERILVVLVQMMLMYKIFIPIINRYFPILKGKKTNTYAKDMY